MTITTKKVFTTSINLNDEDKRTLVDAYHYLSRIDDVIQNNCDKTLTDFAATYYGDILSFLHSLFSETDEMAECISEYINKFS